VYDGELRAAAATTDFARLQRAAVLLKVDTEVRAAHIRYQAARERLAQYDEAVLADSDRLLEMARYAFQQGAWRLFELLAAQRTWTELHLGYEAALADHARALVALETAAGFWDLGR
jgi:cobalt-zinc-cadmium efflux system outer membrane protein